VKTLKNILIFLDTKFYKTKRIDLYRIWQKYIGKKFEFKCQLEKNAMLCVINVANLSVRKGKILENLSIGFLAKFLEDGKVKIA